MGILGKYLTRLILVRFAVALTGLTVFLLSLDLMVNGERVLDDSNGELTALFRYSVLRLPELASSLIKFASLIAGLLTFTALMRRNEVAPIWSMGVSQFGVMLKLVPVAIVLGGFQFFVDDRLVPIAIEGLGDWNFTQDSVALPGRAAWFHTGNSIVAIPVESLDQDVFSNIKIFEIDQTGNLTGRIDAAEARFDGEESWTLTNATQRILGQDLAQTHDVLVWRSDLDPSEIKRLTLHPKRLAIGDLSALASGAQRGYWVPHYYATWMQARLALALTPALMLFLIVALARRFQRTGHIEFLFLGGLGTGFCYFILSGIGVAMGEVGLLPFLLAGWGPIAAFAVIIAAIVLWREVYEIRLVDAHGRHYESDGGEAVASKDGEMTKTKAAIEEVALLIVGECDAKIWGRRPQDRLIRGFARAGVNRVLAEEDAVGVVDHVVLVRADIVLDAPVVAALARSRGVVLLSGEGSAAIPIAANVSGTQLFATLKLLHSGKMKNVHEGVKLVSVEEIGSTYWPALRKREVPYATVINRLDLAPLEWRMFMGTYKGATDFVTKWVWPRPAYYVTKLCVRAGLTPNMVTFASLLLVFATLYWFYVGAWILGLAAAWGMTFLDTVDGKLARITLNSSPMGNIFDHSIDLIHPPFWYIAWGLGLAGTAHPLGNATLTAALVIIVAGYILQRLIEGASIYYFKIEIHIWRPVDTLFRQVTARRNPNLALMTICALAWRPDIGLLAVAAWTAICLGLHLLQLVQAYLVWRRDGVLHSWLTQNTPAP